MRPQRGFTLVEVSIVVVLVGVLATVSAMLYRQHRTAAHVAEATGLANGIRAAQEQYKAEIGTYANVSTTETSYYPAPTPGPFKTAWGGACGGNCNVEWTTLHVRPDGPVMYGYATVAGAGGTTLSASLARAAGAPPPAPGMSPPASGPASSTDPFYVVAALGDTDGDGQTSLVIGSSASNDLIVTTE